MTGIVWRREQSPATLLNAARNALARGNVDPRRIGAIYVGSESHPYAVKPTGTVVGEAIGAAAKRLRYLPEASLIMGIPLSAQGRNPYFGRI